MNSLTYHCYSDEEQDAEDGEHYVHGVFLCFGVGFVLGQLLGGFLIG